MAFGVRLVAFGLVAPLVLGGCTDRVELGRQLYARHGCAVCHGSTGRGDGPTAGKLTPPPRDLADPRQYTQGSSEEAIAETIATGVARSPANGAAPNGVASSMPATTMPAFHHIPADERRAIAAWIVSQRDRAASPIVLRDAWVRESTATRTVSAGYVTIDNGSSRDVTLVGVTVSGAKRAELHATVQEQGQASMRSVATVRIPAGSSVALAPGGTHVMLFDVDPPFTQNRTVTITLAFDDHAKRSIRAVVRPLGATSVR